MSNPTFDNVVILPVVRSERVDDPAAIAFEETGVLMVIVPKSLRIDMRAIARKENQSLEQAASNLQNA